MPQLEPELSLLKDVDGFLHRALPQSSTSQGKGVDGHAPLLILELEQVVAAFCFADSGAREDYEGHYKAFKNLFTVNGEKWDSLDVAFVYCVPSNLEHLDEFCSQVETDAYFCRKFVVPIGADVESALARLPFLPLAAQEGPTLRPPSAQTFLRQCKVPTELAKFVVTQGERSPEGIVQDCIGGRFGAPAPLVFAEHRAGELPERQTSAVTLESITIENFRAYRKKRKFELGSAVTILYGPNGFGKTSFFDAIDFAATGGIGRIPTSSSFPFARAARHLDSSSEHSGVQLDFRVGEHSHTVSRNVEDPKQAMLDGAAAERKSVLTCITGGEIPASDRVENFVSLFRATHLFSQEQQELTTNFRDDCQLSPDVVSRMLAFEDYVNGQAKVAKIEEHLRAVVGTINRETERLKVQILESEAELQKLAAVAGQYSESTSFEVPISRLKEQLADLGIPAEKGATDLATVKGWRTSIEGHSSSNSLRIDRLLEASALLTKVAALQQQSSGLDQSIQSFETSIASLERDRMNAERSLAEAERDFAQSRAEETELVANGECVSWMLSARPQLERLQAERKSTEQQSRALDEAHPAIRLRHELSRNSLNEKNQVHRINLQAIGEIEGHLGELQLLQEDYARVLLNGTDLKNQDARILVLRNRVEQLKKEQKSSALAISTVEERISRLSESIDRIDEQDSDLKNLLDHLKSHVNSGVCPACGDEHGSAEALLAKMNSRFSDSPSFELRTLLTKEREALENLQRQLDENTRERNANQEALDLIEGQRDDLMEIASLFNSEANRLGFNDSVTGTFADWLVRAISEGEQQRNTLTIVLDSLDTEIQAVEAEQEQSAAALRASSEKILAAKERLAAIILEHQQLEQSPQRGSISIDSTESALSELKAGLEAKLLACREDIVKRDNARSQANLLVNAKSSEVEATRRQVADLKNRVAALLHEVSSLHALLRELGLPSDISEAGLRQTIHQQSLVGAKITATKDVASALEVALDAFTTAAALESLRNGLREKQGSLDSLVKRAVEHQPWVSYFKEMAALLAKQQNESTARFTEGYGPRTAVIQRRLRPVYGFDDVEVSSKNGIISVRVKRNGEAFRPIDYFSQSQQQTLFLGMFLTACSSQTWSSFSPIFLDDPVTHFDDLNIYALLDLISGLIHSTEGPRQFVISTCDEKLLQLARQKFRHLGEKAKFYRFSAIGAEGPLVNLIPTV